VLKIENPSATDQAQWLNNSIQVTAKMHSKEKEGRRLQNLFKSNAKRFNSTNECDSLSS